MNIITGMHRSGTSLIAHLFCETGADLGDSKSFYPADKWNPDGYYEQPAIQRINMKLVRGPFWKFSYFFLPSEERILNRSKRLASQIHNVSAEYSDKLVKETRFSLTLPAWRVNGADIGKVLICLRDPYAVARSLKRRNRISMAFGLKLWRIHNERLLDAVSGVPHHVISYRHLLDPASCVDEMVSACEFMEHAVGKNELRAACGRIIKPAMNHSSEAGHIGGSRISELWNRMLSIHDEQGTS